MSIWNHRTLVLHPDYAALHDFMLSLPERFARGEGELLYDRRNKVRRIEYEGRAYVVKQFCRPNVVNRFVYGLLRSSKAKRSYCNALGYLALGVGTPRPVGYMNIRDGLLFGDSYFVTLASTCRYLYPDLFTHDLPFADEVLRAIGRANATLHNHGWLHKDYSRGNLLFDLLPSGEVQLEIIDLNRMAVGPVDVKKGCKNFERLPATPHMHRVMAEAYAEARGMDADECFRLMQAYRSRQGDKIDGRF